MKSVPQPAVDMVLEELLFSSDMKRRPLPNLKSAAALCRARTLCQGLGQLLSDLIAYLPLPASAADRFLLCLLC